METVLLQDRLYRDSALTIQVLWRQCSYKQGCVETVVLQARLCGDSGLTSKVVWRQWSYKTGSVEAVVYVGSMVLLDKLYGTVVIQERFVAQ